jgi:ribose transport system substrate-binding protein
LKKIALLAAVLLLVGTVVVVNVTRRKSGVEPLVWYGLMPHPYKTEVRSGVERFEQETGQRVLKVVGQQWTQDNENVNVEALSTRGHKGFSIYPGDPAGANALFGQLKGRGQIVVAYGAEPGLPTPVPFTVATDIKAAAMTAAEKLIEFMGGKGRILNVLEMVTDINTKKRDDGIREVVAGHPGVEILQTISDMTQVSEATVKIQSALAARMDEIDGMIATGYNPTIAAASVLAEWHKDPKHKKIRFIGIDTGETVLQAIRDGAIDATVAQNPPGHGYITCLLLKYLLDGWTPVKDYQYIDAGIVIVTKENLSSYAAEVRRITDRIGADLTAKYLRRPN